MIFTGFKNIKTTEDGFQFSDLLAEYARVKPNEIQGVDKATRQKWLLDPKTEYCVFTAWEGTFPTQRINVSAGNPAHKLHGLVVDYDAPSPASLAEIAANTDLILSKTPVLSPQWVGRTPGGNNRLVWEFDRALTVAGSPDIFLIALLDELKKLLKLTHLLPNLDESALKRPAQVYDIGGSWERHNPHPLPLSEVQGAYERAVSKASHSKTKGGPPTIPMDVIFSEIQNRFPDKWPKGLPFKEGVQGPAVWDPDASNPRSTIYHPTGVWCFSSEDRNFKPYSEIFGKDFTRKWEENKIGAATESIYYVPGAGYYRKWADTHWRLQPKEDLTLYLAGAQNLSRAKGPGNIPSEVENALLYIQQAKVLDGAIPVVYDRREIVEMSGKKLLNTARVKVMLPDTSLGKLKWSGDPNKCPFWWIASWLWSFFATKKQLVYFLSWLKLFWQGAKDGHLTRGHAVFIVGSTNKGKTVLNAEWIPMLMGGGADAGEFLVQGKQFNKNLLEVGHWHIDDNLAATDKTAHQKFSERVKALIANPLINYRPMYVDTQMVPFNGRAVITLNGDAGSLAMIPDLDRNIEDKLIVLRLNDKSSFRFKGEADNKKMLREQSRAFLQWMDLWEPPEWLCNPNFRFGMRNYICEEVRYLAAVNSFEADLLGVIEVLCDTDDEWKNLRETGQCWSGTSAQLTQIISSYPNVVRLITGMTVRSMGMRLSKLSKTSGSGIKLISTNSKHKGQSPRYSIHPISK